MMLGCDLSVPCISQKLGRGLRRLGKGWKKRLEKKRDYYQALK